MQASAITFNGTTLVATIGGEPTEFDLTTKIICLSHDGAAFDVTELTEFSDTNKGLHSFPLDLDGQGETGKFTFATRDHVGLGQIAEGIGTVVIEDIGIDPLRAIAVKYYYLLEGHAIEMTVDGDHPANMLVRYNVDKADDNMRLFIDQ